MKITSFSVILHLISGLNAEAIADSEGLEIFQPILPVQVDLSMITDVLAELKENMKTVTTQTKTMENQIKTLENQIKTVEKQVQSELDLNCTSKCELEKRLAALEKKILEPINPSKPIAPTNSSIDPITRLKWSSILGGCVEPEDENGWILLQQRDTSEKYSFDRTWYDYKNGFQESEKAYWLGLQAMHEKTSTGKWKVAIVYHCDTLDQKIQCVVNEDFKVDSESTNFKLNVGREVQHKGIDPDFTFSHHNNQPFTTRDRYNDKFDDSEKSCAERAFFSGWWFNNCYQICANCYGFGTNTLDYRCNPGHTFMAMKNVKEVQ